MSGPDDITRREKKIEKRRRKSNETVQRTE